MPFSDHSLAMLTLPPHRLLIVDKMHQDGKTGHIKLHRIEALNQIGFVWSKYDMQWQDRYEELCAYCDTHGDCNTPSKYPPSPRLPKWLEVQRKNYRDYMGGRPSNMTPERKGKLDEIGFVWKVTARHVAGKTSLLRPKKPLRPDDSSHNADWEKNFEDLAAYRAEFGDTRVNRTKVKGQYRLKIFVGWQRKQYRKFIQAEPSQLTPDRILRLEDLGFEWTVNSKREFDACNQETKPAIDDVNQAIATNSKSIDGTMEQKVKVDEGKAVPDVDTIGVRHMPSQVVGADEKITYQEGTQISTAVGPSATRGSQDSLVAHLTQEKAHAVPPPTNTSLPPLLPSPYESYNYYQPTNQY